MYSPKRVSEAVAKVRRELGLSSSYKPKVASTHFDPETGTLLIFMADRPDKSAVLGHGGWLSSRLKTELGVEHLGVRAKTDVDLKKFRIKKAIRRLKSLLSQIHPAAKDMASARLIPLLENELKYPRRNPYEAEPISGYGAVVGFSGGVDSASALILLWRAGLNPLAVTVNPGTWLVPLDVRKTIDTMVKRLGVEHHYLDLRDEYDNIFKASFEGRIHPCGRCHLLIESHVRDHAMTRGIPVISFGDLLSTGGYSSSVTEGVLRFNPCAALALTKLDTIMLARQFGHPGTRFTFGCPMLRETFRLHPEARMPSISRVLRETRAGVLDPGQALRYIESIIRSEG